MRQIQPKKTLVEQTYETLVDAICSGELPPGERLAQEEIATRLNVSRQPVNNALAMLKSNGFVEETGRRGVVVSEISPDQFRSIYEFRTAVEPFAVRLAAERLPGDAARQAEKVMKDGKAAFFSGSAKAQVEADIAFHEMLYHWAGNAIILSTMRMNWQHIRRAMNLVIREGVTAETSWQEHNRIIEALMRGDVAQAAAEMEGHIVRAQAKTMEALERPRP
jgi:DNA-binding GntR family transcriptional regulator